MVPQQLRFNAEGRYEFDLPLVIDLLKEYAQGVDTSRRFGLFRNSQNRVYGIQVYDCLTLYMKYLLKDRIGFDIRPFHLLWEHKKCIRARLAYMAERCGLPGLNPFREACEEMEKTALVARNMMLKYEVTRTPRFLLDNVERIDAMKEKESEVLDDLIAVLEEPHSDL